MAGNSSSAGKSNKQDERRARNLASANASRQRRREEISALTEEKARLTEANEMMRARLSIQPSGSLPSARSVASGSGDVDSVGPGMQAVLRRKDIDGKAVVDMFDRAISGGKGKGAPLDADAGKKYGAAARKAPKDVKRPLKYVEPGSGSKKSAASGSKTQAKSKGSSSKKR